MRKIIQWSTLALCLVSLTFFAGVGLTQNQQQSSTGAQEQIGSGGPDVTSPDIIKPLKIKRGKEQLAEGTPIASAIPGTAGKVAIYGSPGDLNWNTDVRNKILSTGLFSQVDVYDAATHTPTLAELKQYCSVLIYTDFRGITDATTYGNLLADYVDAGGGVVAATFYYNIGFGGRLVTANYLPFTTGPQTQGTQEFLVKDVPSHPIFSGVNSFNGGFSSFHNIVALTPGATLLGHWTDGRPLVAIKQPSAGITVGLNFFPPSSDCRSDFWPTSTDGGRLMANALNFACGQTDSCPTTGCLQDDSNPGNVVRFNAFTGQYTFCCNGVVQATGTGVVNRRGCVIEIQDNASTFRVMIKADLSANRGSAALQKPISSVLCTITDRNTANNTCNCGT
jgi:hypothetical protein